MILTGSIFAEMLLIASGTEPTEELLIEISSTFDDSFALNIWLAKCKISGRSTSHVQISNLFLQVAKSAGFSSSGGGNCGGGNCGDGGCDGAFLLDELSSSTLSLSKYIISINWKYLKVILKAIPLY